MSGQTTGKQDRENGGWREIRHYAYVNRPFEDVWPLLAADPQRVVGVDQSWQRGSGRSALHARLAGVEVSREVDVTFGGVVCDDERASLALRWGDARHPRMFPLLEAVLELAPLSSGRRRLTQVGLVGHYRPPLGTVGGVADRVAGGEVAAESVGRFVEEVARRLEAMIEPEPPAPEAVDGFDDDLADAGGGEVRRVFLPLERLGSRAGGALGVRQRLAAVPGVVSVEVDPDAGLAEMEYDPSRCSPGQLLDDLEEDGAPAEGGG